MAHRNLYREDMAGSSSKEKVEMVQKDTSENPNAYLELLKGPSDERRCVSNSAFERVAIIPSLMNTITIP